MNSGSCLLMVVNDGDVHSGTVVVNDDPNMVVTMVDTLEIMRRFIWVVNNDGFLILSSELSRWSAMDERCLVPGSQPG